MDAACAISERRFYPRHRVRVAVMWRDRQDQLMTGEICDISAHGLFLVSTSAIPDDVGVGDTTHVILSTKLGQQTLVGQVRWRGFHPLHQSIGCGICLDEPSAEVIGKLFPILQKPSRPSRPSPSPAE
jgi:hypothetical protein